MADEEQETDYFIKLREDEEMEFFMDLAIHETERWIQAVTKKSLLYQDDTRKSLENGVLLCELLNCLQPGVIKRINKLPTPIAGLDNINVFLKTCKSKFGLTDAQLFNPSDLEDLSQRAIAETDQLKDEYDKRLINVAITIFWLGKYATKNYQGPQLDLSAYSAFVHHKHSKDLVDTDFHREQATTLSSQWDWSHGIQGKPVANSNSVDLSFHHTRNSSYDSFEKESVDSLDETDGKMPMTRYSSASALNKTRDSQNFSTFDSSYSNDRNSSLYRSSPDLTHGNSSHRRYSSTDSMDGSHNSGHSRQGSDAQEITYVTRRLSSQSNRKSSSSLDPLQFVKLKGANDLAYTAEVQMRVAAESKIAASVTRAKDDDADWQSNLSSWKNRRKSQSERTHHLMQDLEQKEEIQQTSAPKTFSQMQEEREKRKSVGRSFYPIDDENDDAFAPDTSKKLVSSSSSFIQTYPKDGISPWAKDSEDEDEKGSRLQDTKSTKVNGVNSDEQNDKNNNFSDTTEDEAQEITKSSSRSKLAEKLRAFDNDDNDTSYSKIGNTDKRYQRFKDDTKSNVSINNSNNLRNSQSFQNDTNISVKSDSNAKLNSDFTKQDTNGNANAQKDNYKRSESYGKAKDMFSKSDSVSDWDNSNQKITTVYNVGSRTQSKIGSIMKNFADSENKVSGPKQGYNEKIDLGARKSAFMKESTDTIDAPVPARRSFAYQSKEDSESSSGDEEEEEENEIHRDSWDSNKISLPSSEPPIPSSHPPSFTQKPVAAVAPASVAAPVAGNNAKKKSVEKTIKISQKANSDKGFGFFLTGGVEKDAPITVSKVTLGSSADLNDLKVKDIILSVNQFDVSNKSTIDVGDIVAKAVSTGYIEMKIRRDLHEDDFDDDEEDFSSSEESEQDLHPSEQFHNIDENSSTSVMSQLEAEKAWLEQQIEDSARREAEERKIDKVIQEQTSLPSLDQKNKVTAQSHLTLSLDRNQDSLDDTLSPSSVNTRPSPSSSQILDDDSDGSGPPAILRKWQRQRHKEEYTFDTGAGSDISETFKRISLNASIPRRDSYEDNNSYDSNVTSQKWEKRLEDWNQQQDKQRLYGDFIDQAKVAEESDKLHEKYEQEMKKAEEKKAEKKREEELALQSQIDTARVLEERKAERRARIQQTAAEAAGTYAQREPTQPQLEKSHTTSMTLNINRQQYPLNEDVSVLQKKSAVPLSSPANTLIIDPRNQQKPSENTIQFQMKVGPQTSVDKETILLLETERERIRLEELKKIEEERRRLEEEHKAREKEKLRALKEKEEEVRRQQEMLELERKKFLKEQEEFKKQQQELLFQKQQQEQLLKKQQQEQLVQKQHQEQLLQKQQQEHLLQKQQQQENDIHMQRVQPVAAKRHSASPVPREKSNSTYGNSILSSPPKPAYSSTLPSSSRNSYSHTTASNHFPGSKSSSSSRVSKNLENSSSVEEVDLLNNSQRFSREQMLAMNRKATPMQAVPPELQEAKPEDHAPLSPPITREAPSKVELRSLNSVPRAKFRDPSEIYVNIGATNPALSPRQTEPSKRQTASWMDNGDDRKSKTFSFDNHWLVEEAERRRLAESLNKQPSGRSSVHSSHFTGPIKPANDNRWRGGSFDGNQAASMPQAIRQTLLQKTSGMRGSTPDLTFSSGSSRSSSRSPSFPSHDDASHYSHISGQQSYSTQYNHQLQQQSRLNHSSTDDTMGPVNGKQPCSHCNEEIGFGTAMVIEALGLFYHVQCFRCCVCHTSLGSGQHGADVRVRGSKLHCPNCYSNDEGVRKSSQTYNGRLMQVPL